MKKCPFLTVVLLMVIWELVKYFGFVQVAAASTTFSINIPPKFGGPPKMVGKYSAISPNEKNEQVQGLKAVLKAASGKDFNVTTTKGSGGSRKTQVNLKPAKSQPEQIMSKVG